MPMQIDAQHFNELVDETLTDVVPYVETIARCISIFMDENGLAIQHGLKSMNAEEEQKAKVLSENFLSSMSWRALHLVPHKILELGLVRREELFTRLIYRHIDEDKINIPDALTGIGNLVIQQSAFAEGYVKIDSLVENPVIADAGDIAINLGNDSPALKDAVKLIREVHTRHLALLEGKLPSVPMHAVKNPKTQETVLKVENTKVPSNKRAPGNAH